VAMWPSDLRMNNNYYPLMSGFLTICLYVHMVRWPTSPPRPSDLSRGHLMGNHALTCADGRKVGFEAVQMKPE
jgi:hypothetical protein